MILHFEEIICYPQLNELENKFIEDISFVKSQINTFATLYEYELSKDNLSQYYFSENFVIYFLEWFLENKLEEVTPITKVISITNCLFNTTLDPCMYDNKYLNIN